MWEWLKKLHEFIGPLGDAAALADLMLNLKRAYQGVYESLPNELKARLNRGDSFNQFADAVAQLDPHEKEAIRELLRALRPDQRRQERFIMKAVVNGGLTNAEATIRLLKDLAGMDTTEAIEYLVDLDFTQPSVTEPAHLRERVGQAATWVGRGLADAWNAADDAVAPEIFATATAIDNARGAWTRNNFGIDEPLYRRIGLPALWVPRIRVRRQTLVFMGWSIVVILVIAGLIMLGAWLYNQYAH